MHRFLDQGPTNLLRPAGAARDPSDFLGRYLIRQSVAAKHQKIAVLELHTVKIGDDLFLGSKRLEDDVAVLALGRFLRRHSPGIDQSLHE